MKKSILTLAVLCGIGLMAGCKSGTANENTSDTTAVATWNADEWEHEWERLLAKIRNGDTLLPEEWSFFFENIDKVGEEYSEGVGYCLYNALAGQWYSEHVAREGLAQLSPEKREHVLEQMMYMMSIDIMIEEHTYTWDEFQIDFPVFEGSKAAEKALEEINKWKKEESNL